MNRMQSGDIQSKLDELSRSKVDPQWVGARNTWIKALGSGAVGEVGEEFALSVLGGERVANNRIGYDTVLGDKLIEVKLSTVISMNGRPILIWRQIRPSDPYTHICFIAVYPNTTRMFLVPRQSIPNDSLKHQHGRGQSLEIFQIHSRKVNELLPWMTANEIKTVQA